MPKISTYQTVTPQGDDTIIISQANGSPTDATKNITVNSLTSLVQEDAGMLYIDTEISSAQILDLHNTNVVLIPEPTDGSIFYPSAIFTKYIFNTTPYTQALSETIQIRSSLWSNGVRGTTLQNISFDSSGDYRALSRLLSLSEQGDFSTELDAQAPITGGDGTIKIRTYYSVIPSTF